MKLSRDFATELSKQYESNSVDLNEIKGNDVAFKTDVAGNPVLLFIGHKPRMQTKRQTLSTRIKERFVGDYS